MAAALVAPALRELPLTLVLNLIRRRAFKVCRGLNTPHLLRVHRALGCEMHRLRLRRRREQLLLGGARLGSARGIHFALLRLAGKLVAGGATGCLPDEASPCGVAAKRANFLQYLTTLDM